MKLRTLAIAFAALAGACAATSLKSSWKSPQYHGGPVGDIAVVAIDPRGLVRQGFENRFVRQFGEQQQKAFVTFSLLPLEEINADKAAAAAKLKGAGADSVLIIRLLDSATYASEVQLRNTRFGPGTQGVQGFGWYDYFTSSWRATGAIYGTQKSDVFLEIDLFDLDTEKLVWSGITMTVVKEGVDRVELIDPLIRKVLAAMRADGVIH
ncbi:MAG: hypothetical protein U1F98_02975 [Verrucomicrobiota bacterium]